MSWSARFHHLHWSKPHPIPLPDGTQLHTLDDARAYVLDRPEGEHADWQPAVHDLLMAAEHGGPWMDFARMQMTQTLARNDPPKPFTKRVRERSWLPAKRVAR